MWRWTRIIAGCWPAWGMIPWRRTSSVTRSGFPAFEVASMLLLLELQGQVISHPGGRYSLRGG
jgi:predicted Rossmann fold nucleotide-binding protein DprA/Smf involved in DNA uptake